MAIPGLATARDAILELKEHLLDKMLNELQEAVHGTEAEMDGDEMYDNNDPDEVSKC